MKSRTAAVALFAAIIVMAACQPPPPATTPSKMTIEKSVASAGWKHYYYPETVTAGEVQCTINETVKNDSGGNMYAVVCKSLKSRNAVYMTSSYTGSKATVQSVRGTRGMFQPWWNDRGIWKPEKPLNKW